MAGIAWRALILLSSNGINWFACTMLDGMKTLNVVTSVKWFIENH